MSVFYFTLANTTNSLINCLTPWIRVLLEKQTVPQLVKKFPTLYGTRRFVTVFTTARHYFPSRAVINVVHAIPFQFFKTLFNIILLFICRR
jgi:hypothetical protein